MLTLVRGINMTKRKRKGPSAAFLKPFDSEWVKDPCEVCNKNKAKYHCSFF